MANQHVTLVFGACFSVIALVCWAVALGTEHWVEYTVEREEIRAQATVRSDSKILQDLDSEPIYFTRYRGMFRTCYPGNETLYVARAFLAVFIIGMVFLVIGMMAIAASCYQIKSSTIKLCALFNALASVITAVSMGLFHGMEYMENNKVEEGVFYANIKADPDYQLLVDNMSVYYGYSYILAWIGVGCGFVSCIILLCLAMVIAAAEDVNRRVLVNHMDDYTLSNQVNGPAKMVKYDQSQMYPEYSHGLYPYVYPQLYSSSVVNGSHPMVEYTSYKA